MSAVKPIPAPTPPVPSTENGSLLDDLCTRAAREVKAARLIIDSQDTYIKSLEEKDKIAQDFIKQQKDINDGQKELIASQKEIIASWKTERDNLLKQRENDAKIIEELKKQKCGLKCTALHVLTGIGIGAILFF